MANLSPATNIKYMALAGAFTTIIAWICQSNGITLPPDVVVAITSLISVGVGHGIDVMENVKYTKEAEAVGAVSQPIVVPIAPPIAPPPPQA